MEQPAGDQRPPRNFLSLPPEIKNLIYSLLLESKSSATTWGKGSGISAEILATCRAINREASPFLYNKDHVLCFALQPPKRAPMMPPTTALRRLRRIIVQIEYATRNRGDCEVSMCDHTLNLFHLHSLAQAARHSTGPLEYLRIVLLNQSCRKRGPKLVRSDAVREQMREILLPFAFVPTSVHADVGGFDAIEWTEMFEEMRGRYAGKAIHYEDMLDEALTGAQLRNLHRSF